jgi:hypothetical protein
MSWTTIHYGGGIYTLEDWLGLPTLTVDDRRLDRPAIDADPEIIPEHCPYCGANGDTGGCCPTAWHLDENDYHDDREPDDE